jgi:hypothetical protein
MQGNIGYPFAPRNAQRSTAHLLPHKSAQRIAEQEFLFKENYKTGSLL